MYVRHCDRIYFVIIAILKWLVMVISALQSRGILYLCVGRTRKISARPRPTDQATGTKESWWFRFEITHTLYSRIVFAISDTNT